MKPEKPSPDAVELTDAEEEAAAREARQQDPEEPDQPDAPAAPAAPAAPEPMAMSDQDLRAELSGENFTWLENYAADLRTERDGGPTPPGQPEFAARAARQNALAEEHLRRTGVQYLGEP